jgi:molecular chaperone GrpE
MRSGYGRSLTDRGNRVSRQTADGRWRAVQNDVIALMRELDAVKTELAKTQEKANKERVQLLLDMLDVLDSFERVFANIEPREQAAERQARIWVGNFRSVRRVLENHLKKHEVVHIEAPEGKAVPGFHTILETREQLDLENGTILEEVQKGYLRQGVVLRKAQVIAVKN